MVEKIIQLDNISPINFLGVENCTNDNILIISAHCEVVKLNPTDVINNLDSEFVAVWGKQIPLWNGKKITPEKVTCYQSYGRYNSPNTMEIEKDREMPPSSTTM